MYTSQIKPGDTYDKLKKCVTINIVDFDCTSEKKPYSVYHLTEDKTKTKLTDILEIYFLEIPKLFDDKIKINEKDPVIQWMEFIGAKSKGEMEMIANKNKDIKKAYDVLQILSKDSKAKMLYEARQAEISDQLTRIKSAEDIGIEKGIEKGIDIGVIRKAVEDATNLLMLGVSEEIVSKGIGLPIEKILEIKNGISELS